MIAGLLNGLLIGLALAGNDHISVPGEEAWSAPASGFDLPDASCPSCEGPVAFAVKDGVGWILLQDRLVSTEGASVGLPQRGLDVAAGPGGLWVLTESARYRVAGGALVPEAQSWSGQPLEIAGDGAVMSLDGVGKAPLSGSLQSPWGADKLRITKVGDGRWSYTWGGGKDQALPGSDVVDVRPSGLLADGRVVLALTDSADRSAEDGVRFVAVSGKGVALLNQGAWNGGDWMFRRSYAVDPADGSIWTLMVFEDRLSLRRYP